MNLFKLFIAIIFLTLVSSTGLAADNIDLSDLKLFVQGSDCMEKSDYVCARNSFTKLLPRLQMTFGRDSEITISAMFALGEVESELGNHAKSLALFQEIMEIQENNQKLHDDTTLLTMWFIGHLYQQLHSYSKSREILESALNLQKEHLKSGDVLIFKTMFTLAHTYEGLGDYERAASIHEENLKMRRAVFGHDHPNTVPVLTDLGSVYYRLGDNAKAEENYLASLRIMKADPKANRLNYFSLVNKMAVLYTCSGELDKGRNLLEEILPLQQAELDADHQSTLTTLYNLAANEHRRKDYVSARLRYERVLTKKEKMDPAGTEGKDYEFLASIYNHLDQKGAALFFAQLAVLSAHTLWSNHSDLTPELRRALINKESDRHEFLAESLLELGRIDEALQVLEALKQDEFNHIFGSGHLPEEDAPEVFAAFAELTEQYNTINQRRRNLYLQRAPYDDDLGGGMLTDMNRGMAFELDLRMDLFMMKLPEAANSVIKNLSNGRQRFSQNKEFQEYLKTVDAKASVLHVFPAQSALWLVYITEKSESEADHEHVEWDTSRHDFEGKIDTFLEQLNDQDSDPRRLGSYFYEKIISPIKDQLIKDEAETLVLVMHGPLRYLPPAAFYNQQDKKWLAEEYSLIMFTDASRTNMATERKPSWSITAFGSRNGYKNLPPLSYVTEEISALVSSAGDGCYLKNKDGDQKATDGLLPGECLIDDKFVVPAFYQGLARDYNVAHIATHFVLDENEPEQSYLLLGQEQLLTLSAFQQASPQLNHLDLITFSACQTGRGLTKQGTGREIENLGTLAQKMGARSVLASLWLVDDESTKELMIAFYQAREQGRSKAHALREAQLRFLTGQIEGHSKGIPSDELYEGWRHPYYWAPFILMGNWI